MIKLRPGDHVSIDGMTYEQFDSVCNAFIKSGAERGESNKYNYLRDRVNRYLGWDANYGVFFSDDFDWRLLTIDEVIGSHNKWQNGRQMKTTADCWRALIDRDRLTFPHMVSKYIYLDNEDVLRYDSGARATHSFHDPENWYTYEEPEWYEDIPKVGVACWVSDDAERPNSEQSEGIDVIAVYIPGEEYPFIGVSCWKYATRLTKEEIRVFLNNAPEK